MYYIKARNFNHEQFQILEIQSHSLKYKLCLAYESLDIARRPFLTIYSQGSPLLSHRVRYIYDADFNPYTPCLDRLLLLNSNRRIKSENVIAEYSCSNNIFEVHRLFIFIEIGILMPVSNIRFSIQLMIKNV